MASPEASSPGPIDRVKRIKHAVTELCRAHEERLDEGYIEEALHVRARILRGIQETHGSAPSILQTDHRKVVIGVIDERIRLARNMYESLVGISPDSMELYLGTDGMIRPNPSAPEKSS